MVTDCRALQNFVVDSRQHGTALILFSGESTLLNTLVRLFLPVIYRRGARFFRDSGYPPLAANRENRRSLGRAADDRAFNRPIPAGSC
jgi:hypothetical protein